MRLVEQTGGVIADVAGQQALHHRQMRHVGQTADDACIGQAQAMQCLQHLLRVAQVLQQVADHQGVVAAFERGQVAAVEVHLLHPVEMRARGGHRIGRQIDAVPLDTRIVMLVL